MRNPKTPKPQNPKTPKPQNPMRRNKTSRKIDIKVLDFRNYSYDSRQGFR